MSELGAPTPPDPMTQALGELSDRVSALEDNQQAAFAPVNNFMIDAEGKTVETGKTIGLKGLTEGEGREELGNTVVGAFAGGIEHEPGKVVEATSKESVALGFHAGEGFAEHTKRTVAIGPYALESINAAAHNEDNVAIGFKALGRLGAGSETFQNVVIGSEAAGTAEVTGADNVILGFGAGHFLTGGFNNVIIGSGAGNNITEGFSNVLIGGGAGTNIKEGQRNVIIGTENAGNTIVNGEENILIGAGVTGDESNQLRIAGLIGGEHGVAEPKLGFFSKAATPVTRPAKPATLAEVIEALEKLGLVA